MCGAAAGGYRRPGQARLLAEPHHALGGGQKLLGTATPIAWVSPDAITGKDQVWQVPLTVRGTKADKTYNVTLNCNTGEIAYSAPQ